MAYPTSNGDGTAGTRDQKNRLISSDNCFLHGTGTQYGEVLLDNEEYVPR